MRPGRRRPFSTTVSGIEVRNDADFGGHDDKVVVGDVVAARAQAVAVEHGADLVAVREGDRSGPSHGSIMQAWNS
jgi:hypothetical protein